jgi:arylsulfatase
MIANIDENMGKLDAFLRENGLRDNTILVFLTDNGATNGMSVYNAGMRGKKIDLYDGGHRVPCFIRWPAGRLGAPRDVAELTECQDLYPTLLDLCGVPSAARDRIDGVSLAGLLRGETDRLRDRMLVIQFSRMNAPEPKKGDAAVLWQRWRLVQDKELYDLRTDPAQGANVIDRHPEVAARMRAHYEGWWSRIAPRLNEFGPITIGSEKEPVTLLSPCEWQDVFLDQSRQVRAGEAKNGVWNLTVARGGEYEISLRRWPVEANVPIASGVPAYQATDGKFIEGKALPVSMARLQVAAIDDRRPVGKDDVAATFTAVLPAGPARLQTWFLDAEDKPLSGAYYAYVRRK